MDMRKYVKRWQLKTYFPNMGKKIVNQVQEAQRISGRINPRRNTRRHTVIKMTKIKDRDKILKATREKWQIIYKGNSHQAISWFLSRNSTSQKGMAWYIQSDEREEPITKNNLLSKTLFRFDGEIKSFSEKQKLREFSTKNPALQQMWKELLYAKIKRRKRPTEYKPKTINKMITGS